MKNINLKLKLVLVGVIVLLIPLGALGIISIVQSRQALNELMQEQLTKRTEEISDSIYNVLSKEKSFVKNLTITHEAETAFSEEAVSGNLQDSVRFADLTRMLTKISNTEGLGEVYQVLLVADADGIVKAASSPDFIDVDLSAREYLQKALQGKTNIGQAALNTVTNEPFIPVAAPIYNEYGTVVGAAATIMQLDFLWELIKDSTIGDTGYAYVTDANGLFIAHPDSTTLFETELKNLVGMEEISRRFMARESGYEGYVYKGEAKTAGFAIVDEANWGVFLTLPDSEYLQAANAIRNILIIVAVVSFIIAFIVFFFFATSITNPIKKIAVFANDISEGRLYTRVDIDQRDEIGQLAISLRQMQVKLTEVVGGVMVASEQVSSGSDQLAQSSQQLSEGATEQAANAEEVSSSVEQMGANIEQNTDNAAKTEEMASQAAVDIENGGAAVMDAVAAMNEIARKIGVIEEIARNTNLLSLNAAIEAARAGEHGKGFAVVAAEVGKLAATSQKAALEIQELAKTSVNKANAAGEQIQKVVPDIRKTAELVSEISASSLEQNSGAAQISEAMMQLDQVIQQNAASSEEVSSMSEELTSQAQQLLDMVRFFKINADGSDYVAPKATGQKKIAYKQSAQPKKVSVKSSTEKAGEKKPKEASEEIDSDFIEF